VVLPSLARQHTWYHVKVRLISISMFISTVNAMHTSFLDPFAACFSRACAVYAGLQTIIHKSDVVARLPFRTAHARRRLPPIIEVPREIRKHHVTHKHVRSTSRSPVVAAVLGDDTSILGTMHGKVSEEQVPHIAPAAATWLVIGFVVAVSTGDELAYPRLDVDGIADVVLSASFDDRGSVNLDVRHAGVFEVLAQRADGDAIAADAGNILY